MRTIASIAAIACLASAGMMSGASATTLEDVKKRGVLNCGVSQGLPGFSSTDKKGKWSGIDVDLCRAVAAAILGDAEKVKFKALSAKERFTALTSREIDLLSRNTTWTMQRDTALGLNFAGVTYYDGQGFMIRKSLGVDSALKLGGATVCTNAGTTTELNIADFFRANNMKFKSVTFEKSDETVAAYDAGRCDVYTTDRSGLAAQRLKLTKKDDHIVLPEIISKEPLGPVVRHGDDQWLDVVKWTLNAMLNAEELGVTSANARMMKGSKNPAIGRLLGTVGNFGGKLSLSKLWAYNVIRQVGNYGEAYERNLGLKTPLKLARGRNELWTKGGLHYAPPIR